MPGMRGVSALRVLAYSAVGCGIGSLPGNRYHSLARGWLGSWEETSKEVRRAGASTGKPLGSNTSKSGRAAMGGSPASAAMQPWE